MEGNRAPDALLGFFAALGAPLVMSFGLIIWDRHWNGSAVMLNAVKCTIASAFFLLMIPLRMDTWTTASFSPSTPFPNNNSTKDSTIGHLEVVRVDMLVLSAFLGIALGDIIWLQALQTLGARRLILVDSIKPFVGAAFARILLGEKMAEMSALACLMTMSGIVLVATARSAQNSLTPDSPSSHLTPTPAPPPRMAPPHEKLACIACATSPSQPVALDKLDARGDVPRAHTTARALSHTTEPEHMRSVVGVITVAQDGAIYSTTHIAGEMPRFSETKVAVEGYVGSEAKERDTSPHRGEPCFLTSHSQDTPLLLDTGTHQLKAGGSGGSGRSMGIEAAEGYGYACLNVIFDVWGALITKEYGKGLAPWHISLIRFGSAAVILDLALIAVAAAYWCSAAQKRGGRVTIVDESGQEGIPEGKKIEKKCAGAQGRWTGCIPAWAKLPARSSQQWFMIALGAVVCTFVTPILSTYALFKMEVSTVMALTSTGPILSLPLSYAMKGEAITCRSAVGAVLASAGVALFAVYL